MDFIVISSFRRASPHTALHPIFFPSYRIALIAKLYYNSECHLPATFLGHHWLQYIINLLQFSYLVSPRLAPVSQRTVVLGAVDCTLTTLLTRNKTLLIKINLNQVPWILVIAVCREMPKYQHWGISSFIWNFSVSLLNDKQLLTSWRIAKGVFVKFSGAHWSLTYNILIYGSLGSLKRNILSWEGCLSGHLEIKAEVK